MTTRFYADIQPFRRWLRARGRLVLRETPAARRSTEPPPMGSATGVDLGIAALAAVLRNMGGPASRDVVERAVVLSVLPGLLQSKFYAQTAPKWRRAIVTARMKLTTAQLAALRDCPGQPGGRWPSTDAEVAVLEELCELGLVRWIVTCLGTWVPKDIRDGGDS